VEVDGLGRRGFKARVRISLSPWGNTAVGQFSERAGEEHNSLSKDNQRHEQAWTIRSNIMSAPTVPKCSIGTRTSDRIQR
jgi:hypothetical protein